MAYFLGRDVAVTIKAGDHVGVNTDGTIDHDGLGSTQFASIAGESVSDLTGVDLGIGVTDEDITYLGSKTVLKAEIKKETTVSLTRKKIDNVWDVVFNGEARWGASDDALVLNLAGEPDVTTVTAPATGYFGYELLVQLKNNVEVFTVKHCQITAHSLTLNADGTTEETMEFISQENPTITTG
jgi:hypothetical protein